MTTATAAAKKTRNSGPFITKFRDSENGEIIGRAQRVNSLILERKEGDKTVGDEYSLSDLPQAVLLSLAANGLANIMGTYVRNHFDEKKANVKELADKRYAAIKAGEIYPRVTGGAGKGKGFDPSEYVEALARAFKIKHPKKKFSDQAKAELASKLEAMTQGERLKQIAAWKKSPLFAQQLMLVRAERIGAAQQDDSDSVIDALMGM